MMVGDEDCFHGGTCKEMGLEHQLIGHNQAKDTKDAQSRVGPHLSPFSNLIVFINDLTFFKVQTGTGVRVGDLNEGLVKIGGMEDISLQSEESVDGVTKNFGVAHSVSNVWELLLIGDLYIVFVTLITVVVLGDRSLKPVKLMLDYIGRGEVLFIKR